MVNIVTGYLITNLIFATVYNLTGIENLRGADGGNLSEHFYNAFFFSALSRTVVHPLNDDSTIKNITSEDLERSNANFAVLLKAYDDSFSETVHSRTSYQYDKLFEVQALCLHFTPITAVR